MMKLLKQFKIKEILRFCVGGGSAVIVDFVLYYLLKGDMSISLAKGISFVSGAFVGFVINKLWTFGRHKFDYREILKYCVLYLCSATINTLVNKGVLYFTGVTLAAFFVATGCSTIMNFLGQKFFVFYNREG